MKIRNWWPTALSFLGENFLALGLFLGVFFIFLFGLSSVQQESEQERLRILEDSIQRAIVSCYAIEGIYPDGLSYLEENYGLQIDWGQYYVQYDVFASNIMPEVTVIEVDS